MRRSTSVLIMGGSGQAGADTATLLRRWHPALPLTIAGRDLARAQRVADRLGAADAVTIDLARDDLGLPPDREHSAVVATLWDKHLRGLGYAQDRGLPYLSISSGLVDIAPEIVASAQRASAAPILIASHYMAGLGVLATLDAARAFDRIDTIRLGAVLDEQDAGGPAGLADLERWSTATSAGLVRRDGVFTWIAESDAATEVPSVDGTLLPGQIVGILDVPSLALATGAPNVRFDLAIGESASRRRGEPASTELRIDLAGTDRTGTPLVTRHQLVHPEGQRPLTALAIALGVERLLGLRGAPVPPGIHTPEALHDLDYVAARMVEIGAVFRRVED
ncbi:saccharopine dehydrogenase [Nocardia sp. NPDC050712]|uniref:saccharopine dehydrogenase n=1 Tax=Nocardia sp. NPDC050712 TaxID=3155518 RepID=UPI0033CA6F7F